MELASRLRTTTSTSCAAAKTMAARGSALLRERQAAGSFWSGDGAVSPPELRRISALVFSYDTAFPGSAGRNRVYALWNRDRKARRPLILRMVDHLPGIALLHNNTAVHENKAVGHIPGKCHFMGDDDHGHMFLRQRTDHLEDLAGELRIQCGGGFVEKQQLPAAWPGRERWPPFCC